MKVERLHGLDALRAFALLLGVVLHAALAFVLPPGLWAVGTAAPNPALGWLVYYLHSFRLEVFFLMAGFFGAMVIERRGARNYARDRALRILLVFVLALYPMKLALASVWIWGGFTTGWLKAPQTGILPMSAVAAISEKWPNINLTHLWFLYYLSWISGLYLILRRVVANVAWPAWWDAGLRRTLTSRLAPLWLALAVTPIVASMRGMDIDTPDGTFVLHPWVLLLYGLVFLLGAWMYRHTDLFAVFAARWKTLLVAGLVVSFLASVGVGIRYTATPWVLEHALALRLATSFGAGLTMACSVLGWLGCFVAVFRQPSALVRYVADASYWVYVAHLPVVTAAQVWFAGRGVVWWLEVPLVAAGSVALLLGVSQIAVRNTWLGTWLRGRRSEVNSS